MNKKILSFLSGIIVILSLGVIYLIFGLQQTQLFNDGYGPDNINVDLLSETSFDRTYEYTFSPEPSTRASAGCSGSSSYNINYNIRGADKPTDISSLIKGVEFEGRDIEINGIQIIDRLCSDIPVHRTAVVSDPTALCKVVESRSTSAGRISGGLKCKFTATVTGEDGRGGVFFGLNRMKTTVSILKEGYECSGNIFCESGGECIGGICEEPAEEDPVEEDPVEEDPVEEDPAEEDPAEEDPVEEDPVEDDIIIDYPLEDECIQNIDCISVCGDDIPTCILGGCVCKSVDTVPVQEPNFLIKFWNWLKGLF